MNYVSISPLNVTKWYKPTFNPKPPPPDPSVEVERGISVDTIRILGSLGHKVAERGAWGSAQSILRTDGLLMGAADSRQRGTLAVGY
jgi:gamma-glutamyltranspeptidase